MKPILSLEFAANMFGNLKPETKARLQSVIDNPCQDTWEDAYCIILNKRGRTLWQSVLEVDSNFQDIKNSNENWSQIPTRELLIAAIKLAVYKDFSEKAISKEVLLHCYK